MCLYFYSIAGFVEKCQVTLNDNIASFQNTKYTFARMFQSKRKNDILSIFLLHDLVIVIIFTQTTASFLT